MVKFGRSKSEQCAKEIIGFLLNHGLWQDTCIYANGKRFGDYDGKTYHYYYGEEDINPWDCVFVEENINPKNYFEWVGDFLSMSFEGPFYDIVNYNYSSKYCNKYVDEFNAILDKYGYYYELGNAWNLSLYKK